MAGPSLPQRLSAAVKAFRMEFPGARHSSTYSAAVDYLYGWPVTTDSYGCGPQSSKTYDVRASAGDPRDNSAVTICLNRIATNFTEPDIEVAEPKGEGDDLQKVENHPLIQLLMRPNEVDDFDSLITAIALDYKADGNGYLLKEFTAGGKVGGLQWLPSWMVEPYSDDPYRLLTHYIYRVNGKERRLAPEEVIHFKFGKDRHNPRKGCSALKSIIYELAADNEASLYVAAILKHLGVVGGILMNVDPDPEAKLTKEQAAAIEARYREKFTGAGRGGLMVPTFKAEYKELGRSPEDMALDIIRQVPEARICAAVDVPAMVAGLSVGDNQRTYSNYAEAREAFYEDGLIPMQRRFARTLTRGLLLKDEKGIGFEPETSNRVVRWNYENVRVLQPDLDKLTDRVGKAYRVYGLLTLNEARTKVGEKAVGPEGDERYVAAAPAVPATEPDKEPRPQDVSGLDAEKALKATTLSVGGVDYVSTDLDVAEISREAFGDLDLFGPRRERWAKEING